MELQQLSSIVPRFTTLSHVQKIKLFAWFLHSQSNKEYFTAADIRNCYRALSLEEPTNINRMLNSLEEKKPKEILKSSRGFALEKRIRDEFQGKYGQRATTVQIHSLLEKLPSRISSIAEKDFLNEAIICLKYGAPRAAIVMCWNLAFDHLCEFVLAKHLAAFNAQLPKSFPKHSKITGVTKKEDFTEFFKESEVIQVCSSAGIITGNVNKILKEKLARRNIAAHPNSIVFTTLQAEEYISDLVNNIILVLV